MVEPSPDPDRRRRRLPSGSVQARSTVRGVLALQLHAIGVVTEAAAALGFAGAVGAYGGFFIPKSFGSSIALTGSINLALFCFGLFYLCCIAVTWWFYVHRQTP